MLDTSGPEGLKVKLIRSRSGVKLHEIEINSYNGASYIFHRKILNKSICVPADVYKSADGMTLFAQPFS